MILRAALLALVLFAGSAHAQTPWLLEDFSTYTSTANLKTNPRGIYADAFLGDGNESFNTDQIYLDTSSDCTSGGGTKCMRYDFPIANVSDYTIGVNLNLPSTTNELWLEIRAKFSSNFTTNGPASGNADYKFIFGRTGTGRFHLMMGTYGTSFSFDYPPNLNEWIGGDSSQYFDGQWHTYRFHMKTGSGGTYKLTIDSTVIYDFGTVTVSTTSIYGVALGRNNNKGQSEPMTLWFGHIKAYNSDPSWGSKLPGPGNPRWRPADAWHMWFAMFDGRTH